MGVLEVNNVSIRYLTGNFKDIGLKEYVMRRATKNYHVQEFWADRDVDFTLEKGDMLGIIGVNGAGKSTLLKVISGIMEPTKGWVKREGNIAALLELGSGFDGDLTVRENTYLRGALLGYTKKFMEETYDQIIDFAELRDFQDRPFKELSSGMRARLAFAIASLVEPDILILDEVLSVGDGAFQTKSAAKMREIIGSGATTILVSHAISQVREMCNKVLWLHKGRQVAFGENVDEICDRYEAFLAGDQSQLGEAYFQAEKADSEEKARLELEEVKEKTPPPKEPSPPAGWGRSLIVVLALCAVLSGAVLFHVWANFEDPIDYARDFESPLEQGWMSTEGSVSVDEDSATVNYDGESEMVWFHMFEWSTRLYTIPEASLVPDNASEIQFDCQLLVPRGLTVVAYLQQFDKDGVRIEGATTIETIDTTAISPGSDGESISFPYSISAKRHEQCAAYSVLFDIRPEGRSGSFSVVDTDTIFK